MPTSQTPPEFAIEARGLDKTYRAQGKGKAGKTETDTTGHQHTCNLKGCGKST